MDTGLCVDERCAACGGRVTVKAGPPVVESCDDCGAVAPAVERRPAPAFSSPDPPYYTAEPRLVRRDQRR